MAATSFRRAYWAAAALVAATVVAYLPVWRAGFIWDDDAILTGNGLIKAADGLRRIWFTTQPRDYWPVTMSVLWAEWRLWGMHAIGYHAVNLALHIAESLLLWKLLRRLAIPGAFLAALLFAVHPVNVESVAWIAEVKNLVAMGFYLVAITAYAGHLEEVAARPTAWLTCGYGLSLLAFTLGMLSKGSVATLPVVLLGLAAWRRPLRKADWLALAPFALISAVFSAVDVWFQGHGTGTVIRSAGFAERLAGAGTVVWFYLSKAVLPLHLVFVYPPWHVRAGSPAGWLPLAAAVAVTAYLLRSPWRAPRFAWGYFCVALVPVMGFADVYFMKFSLVADHYEHLAIIGVVALGAWGWERGHVAEIALPRRQSNFRDMTPSAVACAVVLALIGLTWRQCRMYRNLETLYRTTLRGDPEAWIAHGNLGAWLEEQGRRPEAIAEDEEALRLNPAYPEAQYNLGLVLAESGRLSEAIPNYETAIRLKPDYANAHNNLGNALGSEGRWDEAIAQYETAARLQPGSAGFACNLGRAFTAENRLPEAVVQYKHALSLDPAYPDAFYGLGIALGKEGRIGEAIVNLREAVRLRPDDAAARRALELALSAAGPNR